MIALIDLDSILYTAVYKIVSISDIRKAINDLGKEKAKQWLLQTVYNEGINRCENQLLKLQNYIQEVFFQEITSYELYITTDTNSFRKKLSPSYKSNRKKNKYVWLLREHYRHNDAFCSNTHEADDLIASRAAELGKGNYIVVSIDKDLKQIGGYYWSYYKIKSKDAYGNFIENDYGSHESEYKQKTIDFIGEKEANSFFWKQVLTGDAGDCIKGLKGIGAKRAEKILSQGTNNFIRVARAYIEKEQKHNFWTAYRLLKLGA